MPQAFPSSPTTPGGLPSAPPSGVAVKIGGNKKILRTNYVPPPYPEILSLLPILEGDISWTENFEGEPSGNLTFKTWWDLRYSAIELLRVGIVVKIWGVGFAISDLQIKEVPTKQHAKPLIEVSISLSGCHRWASDDVPLALNKLNNTEKNQECEPGTKLKDSRQRSRKLSLGLLAARAGGSYSGPAGEILIPNDVTPESSTTFMSELDARLRQEGCFKILWHPTTIKAIQWDSVKNWQIAEHELLKEVDRSFAGEMRESNVASVASSGGKIIVSPQQIETTQKQSPLKRKPFHFLPLGKQIPLTIFPFLTPQIVQENLGKYYHAEHYFPKCELTGLFLDDEKNKAEEKINRGDNVEQSQQSNSANNKAKWQKRERKIETFPKESDFGTDFSQDLGSSSSSSNSSPPNDLGIVKTTSINFDESGSNYVKTDEFITTIDGMPSKKRTVKYGFFGIKGVDLYNLQTGECVGVEASGHWGVIEDTTEVVEYDSQGWRLKSITTGWRLGRHQTENISEVKNDGSNPLEDVPTIKFQPEDGDDDVTKEFKKASLECYEFKKIDVHKIEENILSPYNKYYGDVMPPDFELEEICSPNGQKTYKVIDNISDGKWIDPRFTRESQTYHVAFSEIEDPRNIKIKEDNKGATAPDIVPEYPPLFTGIEEINRTKTEVTSVKNKKWYGSVNVPSGQTMADWNRSRDSQDEDRFITLERKASAGGVSFVSQFSEQTTNTNNGRPAAAPQLPSVWERIEPQNNSNADPQSQNPEQGQRTYYVETSHLPPKGNRNFNDQLTGSSLSYPHAKTLSEAKRAAKTDFYIRDTQASVKENILIFFNPYIRSGDRITYTCNGEVRKRRVLGVSHKVNLEGTVDGKIYVTSPGTSLQLGAELPTSFVFTSKLEPPSKTNKDNQLVERAIIRDLNDIGKITTSTNFQSRVNSK